MALTKVKGSVLDSAETISDKAEAVLITPTAGRTLQVISGDGGLFKAVTGAAAATYSDNGGSYCGTVFIPTGGDGSAAWVRDYSGMLNVRWFGAVGDGVTDDTASIQEAIDTGALYIKGVPGHTYLITGLTQSINNQVIDFTGCTLKLEAASSIYMLGCTGDYVQVIGGLYDGNKAAGHTTSDGYYNHAGVAFTGDYCTVKGVQTKNSIGLGIKGIGTNYSLVTECLVGGFDIQGIYFESITADAYGNKIINNRV